MMARPMTSSTGQWAELRPRSIRRELVRTVNPGHSTNSRLPPVLATLLYHHPIVRCAAANGLRRTFRGQGAAPEPYTLQKLESGWFCACEGRNPKAADTGN
jgi:hypothetical protein